MIIENCLPIEKNEIEKILLDEFKKYVSFSNSKRFQLIKENISFKNKNSITKNFQFVKTEKKSSHHRILKSFTMLIKTIWGNTRLLFYFFWKLEKNC